MPLTSFPSPLGAVPPVQQLSGIIGRQRSSTTAKTSRSAARLSSTAPISQAPNPNLGAEFPAEPSPEPLGTANAAMPSPEASVLPTLPDLDSKISLPPNAKKKLQSWIRSRHLICEGNFYIFETVDFSAVDRFSECIETLGGTVISVEPVDKIWMGEHRQVMLHRVRASLHTPCHEIKQYWIKYGRFRTRFDGRE